VCDEVWREKKVFSSGHLLENTIPPSIGPMVDGPSKEVMEEEEDTSGANLGVESKIMPMSEILDSLLKKNAHIHSPLVDTNEGIALSATAASDVSSHVDSNANETTPNVLPKEGHQKHKKSLVRFQSLPTLGGPKCLRFVAAIQGSVRRDKPRRATSLEEGAVWSRGLPHAGLKHATKKNASDRVNNYDQGPVVPVSAPSDVNWLMNEDS
jgi:hypothetical protein